MLRLSGTKSVVVHPGRSFVSDENCGTGNTEMGPRSDPLAAKAATISKFSCGICGRSFWSNYLAEEWNKLNKKASNYESVSQVDGVKGLIEGAFPSHSGRGVMELEEILVGSGEPRVTENTKTVPQFQPLADKGASISQSSFWIGAPCGFNSSSEKRNKQKKMASNHDPTFQNGGTNLSYCTLRRSVTKPPGLALRCPSPVVAVRAGDSCTEPVNNNSQSQSLTPEMLAFALFAADVLFGAWRGHSPKFSRHWFEIIRASVPYIDMLMKSAPMPTICVALTLSAFILGWMIGLTAERTKASGVEKANAVTDETIVVKYEGGNELKIEAKELRYEGGNELKIEAKGLKFPNDSGNCGELKIEAKGLKFPNDSGNCGKVNQMKIEGSPGASINNFSIVNSFNGIVVNCVGFIAVLAIFVMYI